MRTGYQNENQDKIDIAIELLIIKYNKANYNLHYSTEEEDGITLHRGDIRRAVKKFKTWDAVIKFLEKPLPIDKI